MISTLLLSFALGAEPAPELVALQKKLAETRSLTATFVQKRHWSALKDTLVTEGDFSWAKASGADAGVAGKLVWRTRPPSETELVVEGQSATMRYPALGTTQAFDFSAQPQVGAIFDSILAVLQADLVRLEPLYNVELEKKSPLELTLKPKQQQVSKVVEKVHLTFDKQLNLAHVDMFEPGGDRTEIDFKDHRINGSKK